MWLGFFAVTLATEDAPCFLLSGILFPSCWLFIASAPGSDKPHIAQILTTLPFRMCYTCSSKGMHLPAHLSFLTYTCISCCLTVCFTPGCVQPFVCMSFWHLCCLNGFLNLKSFTERCSGFWVFFSLLLPSPWLWKSVHSARKKL